MTGLSVGRQAANTATSISTIVNVVATEKNSAVIMDVKPTPSFDGRFESGLTNLVSVPLRASEDYTRDLSGSKEF